MSPAFFVDKYCLTLLLFVERPFWSPVRALFGLPPGPFKQQEEIPTALPRVLLTLLRTDPR